MALYVGGLTMKHIKIENKQSIRTEQSKCGGQAERAVLFITGEQLKNRELWHSLAAQFSRRPDTCEWRGEYFGKMMRGGCLIYRYTHDSELYGILSDAMRELLGCADENGVITAYQSGFEFRDWDIWCRKYVMLGQLYFLDICTDKALYDAVLASACRQADCLIAHIGPGKTDILNTSDIWGSLNSSSVLEPIVKLYELTGKNEYFDFAQYIYSRGGCRDINIFKAALEHIPVHEYSVTKAYEMMSNFEGVLELYRVTGKAEYLDAAVSFADMISESEVTLIGGCGTKGEQFDFSAVNQFNPERRRIMLETCVTVTWMKLCLRLLLLTGNGKYADEIEKSAYNALYGALNYGRRSVKGHIFPVDSYSPSFNSIRGRAIGGEQTIEDNQIFGCCVAIVAAGIAIPPLAAVTSRDDGLCCNLYIPCEVSHKNGMLKMQTDYPADGRVKISISGNIGDTAVCLRVPAFDSAMKVCVNGAAVDSQPDDDSYIKLKRCWKHGDEITVDINISPRTVTSKQLGGEEGMLAFCAGPLALCRDSLREGCELDSPVELENGEVMLTAAKAADAQVCYMLSAKQGNIPLYDYASCGQQRDEEHPISVWLRRQ